MFDVLSRNRKLVFSLLTAVLVFAMIEGTARLIWGILERRAFARQEAAGQEILRNDALNFMKVADGLYGYALKPDHQSGSIWINEAGFHQQDSVPVARTPGRLRVICLGESTTFGNDVAGNYPAHLRRILSLQGTPAEVINAGVPGWVSDQVALRAEHQLAAYEPDVVILYVGWNDFQSYNPHLPEPAVSYWETGYRGTAWKQQATTWLRSVALLSALYHSGDEPESIPAATGGNHYKFLLQNIGRIIDAFRAANPEVQVFVSTLVGRWPAGSPESWTEIAPVWWMPRHDVSVEQAAALVVTMNEQIEAFAMSRGARVLDLAGVFERLDRGRLQYDWAHMIADGYELMAWTMYEGLVEAGIVPRPAETSRAAELRALYAVRSRTAAAPNGEGRR